jgi:hypothetical protein
VIVTIKTLTAALAAAVLAFGMSACNRDNAGAGSSADQRSKSSSPAGSGASSGATGSPSRPAGGASSSGSK